MIRRRVIAGLCVVAAAAAGYGAYCWFFDDAHRWVFMGTYGQALEYWGLDMGKPLPATLEELEAAYNRWPNRFVERVPFYAFLDRPVYRPPEGLEDGKLLVMVESRPKHWYGFGRIIFYSNPYGGELEGKSVSASELVELLLQDDRLRAEARGRLRSQLNSEDAEAPD